MDDTLSLIYYGCNLAKDLELNLPNLANLQPNMLPKSCDEIIRVFTMVKERLNALGPAALYPHNHMVFHQELQPQQRQQELLSSSNYTQAMDIIQPQVLLAAGKRAYEINIEMGGGRDLEGSKSLRSSGKEVKAVMDVSADSAGKATPSSQRSRRRKDEGEKRTIMVAAPQIGNTEIPPEDGYTWRKYGQKEILGARFPRSYYRCTHQKLYQCPAKKLVQRLDDDPYTFQVTYRGDHTCHMSSTAPSIPPPPPPEFTQEMTQLLTMPPGSTPPSTSSDHLSKWLEFTLGAGGSGRSMAAAAAADGGSGAGPSTSRYGKEAEYTMVAEMADAMFNSGSSSNNSMDFIFPSVEDHKWEAGDKKK